MLHLIYFADPMCSWCYGFGPQLAALLAREPQARLDLVMGGLRPFTQEPVSDAFRGELRGHWDHVREATGLRFDDAALRREGFRYDTEPACRAVVTARTLDAARALACFKAVQEAFYRDARDVTDAEELAAIAAQCGCDAAAFRERFASQEMREETLRDFSTAQALGVRGFPTLAYAQGRELYLVTGGYTTVDVLDERLAKVRALAQERGGTADGLARPGGAA